ncbi:MAG: ComEC/Rec2 family competence protein [Fimbriimonadia bacterium]
MFGLLRGRPLLQAILAILIGAAAYPGLGWCVVATAGALAVVALCTRRTWLAQLCVCAVAGGLYAGTRAVGADRLIPLEGSEAKAEVVARVLTIPATRTRFTSLIVSVEEGPLPQGTRVLVSTGPGFFALPGEMLRLEGRIKPADGRYWRRQGVAAWMSAARDSIQRVAPTNRPVAAAIASLRWSAERSYLRQMSPESAAMTIGIVFGDDGRVSQETREAMKRAGTYHLLAASGLNVAVVGGLLLGIFNRLRVPRRGAILSAMLGIAAYTFAAGGTPPTVRAAVALCVYLAGAALRRQPDALTALAVGAAYSFVVDPGVLRDPGFQLSYLVAGALIVWCPPGFRWLNATLPGRRERLLRQTLLWVIAGAMASVVASLAATPLLAFYFQSVPLLGPATNMVCVPLAAPILWGGLLGPAGAFIPGWEALWLRGLAAPCADWLTQIGSTVGGLSWSATAVPEFSERMLWLFFLVFFGVAREWRCDVR